MSFPEGLLYTNDHEWVKLVDGECAVVGVTAYAQESLGDIVFVDLPTVGEEFNKKDATAVIESVKAVSDVYSPLTGEVVEVNEVLESTPGLVNSDPYNEGWIFKIRLTKPEEKAELLDASSYQRFVDEL